MEVIFCLFVQCFCRGKGARVVKGTFEGSTYPTLAQSDVPPPLPHRAETTAAHAAQNLLISISLHLRDRDMRQRTLLSPKAGQFFFRDTLNYHSRAGD